MTQGAAGTEYVPRRGSACDLALQQLRAHGRMSRDALALAIDKPADEVRALLSFPINLGAICSGLDADGKCWFEEGSRVVQMPAASKMDTEAQPAGPAGNGSQKPDGVALRSSTAHVRAGSNTPREGANRGVPTGQSHDAGSLQEGHGRGTNGASVPAAAPASIPPRKGAQAAQASKRESVEVGEGHAEGRPDPAAKDQRSGGGAADPHAARMQACGSVAHDDAAMPSGMEVGLAGVASGPLHPNLRTCAESQLASPPVEKPEVDEPALQQLVQLLGEEPAAVPAAATDFLLALRSDGFLMIFDGGRCVLWDRRRVREAARYFAAVGILEWAGAA